MVKVANISCPKCDGVFQIDDEMLMIPNAYFHCPFCHYEFKRADLKKPIYVRRLVIQPGQEIPPPIPS